MFYVLNVLCAITYAVRGMKLCLFTFYGPIGEAKARLSFMSNRRHFMASSVPGQPISLVSTGHLLPYEESDKSLIYNDRCYITNSVQVQLWGNASCSGTARKLFAGFSRILWNTCRLYSSYEINSLHSPDAFFACFFLQQLMRDAFILTKSISNSSGQDQRTVRQHLPAHALSVISS